MNNKINLILTTSMKYFTIIALCFLVSCESAFEFELPEANSKPDTTPPQADFSFNTDPEDFMTIDFTDLSFESTKYLWDFGGGATSTLRDPSYTFSDLGVYPVTLTTSDALNQTSTITKDVLIEEPAKFVPAIVEWGFEDNTLPDGTGDGRDSWRNNDLGGVIQITSSPVFDGDQSAKLTADPADLRIGYQLIPVSPESDYTLRFYYTMKSEPGIITVAILDARELTDISEVSDAVIASIDLSDNSDPDIYVEATLDFNSGPHSEVAIFFNNDGVSESRLDNFTIE